MQIKPCSFCGEIKIQTCKNDGWDTMSSVYYYCWCWTCYTEGPHGETTEEAIEKWNNRPTDDFTEWLTTRPITNVIKTETGHQAFIYDPIKNTFLNGDGDTVYNAIFALWEKVVNGEEGNPAYE